MVSLSMLPRLALTMILAAVVCSIAAFAVAQTPSIPDRITPLETGQAFLDKIKEDESLGVLNPSDSLLLRFQYIFAPEVLPARYRVEQFSPLRCGTDLVAEFYRTGEELDPWVKDQIASYLTRDLDQRATYLSPEGRFQLSYSLSGVDAVPSQDLDPADGIPDFVAHAAQYLDQSWTVEILMTGFSDPLPDEGAIPVSFRAMQNYGYAYVVDAESGLVGIVLHNDFEGFPPNSDPDGDVLGALKVSAAHEFKHCSQYRDSQWRENGWIELDAVWAEDLVFDMANDYYNYLIGGSPIRHPEIPLDGGSTGTGSYEDSVWQHWMSETFGTEVIRDFWERRSDDPFSSVLDTYAEVLEGQGISWPEAWAHFTSWNFLTSNRAIPGLGYQEAAHYPLGPSVETFNVYPGTTTGSVEHLAANFVRLLDLDGGWDGSLEVGLTLPEGGQPLTVAIVLELNDGTGLVEYVTTQPGSTVWHSSSAALHDISTGGVIIGNPGFDGLPGYFELTVARDQAPPEPLLELATPQVEMEIVSGETATTYLLLGNEGEEGSILNFQVGAWSEDPAPLLGKSRQDKNISGSTLAIDPAFYTAGSVVECELTLTNGSTDDEWLTGLELNFPQGVSLIWAGPFEGGSLGDLDWNGADGNGVETAWNGTWGSEGYGVIRDGESATAALSFQIDASFQGPLVLFGTVLGDHYGSAPHSQEVEAVLMPLAPHLSFLGPDPGQQVSLGSILEIAWEQDGSVGNLEIWLSRNGGVQWEWLGESEPEENTFLWEAEGAPSLDCLLRLQEVDGPASLQATDSFVIYPPVSWLECWDTNGDIPQGHQAPVVMDFDATGLEPDSYLAWLLVENDGTEGAAVVPLHLEVLSPFSATGEVPPSPAWLGNHPNPFNPMTSLKFRVTRSGRVRIEVLDLAGRVVRRLVDQNFAAGLHEVTWDGRNDQGQAVASGVYLARMQAPGFSATGKMVLTK